MDFSLKQINNKILMKKEVNSSLELASYDPSSPFLPAKKQELTEEQKTLAYCIE